jgi:hypothetical protein
MRLSKILPKVCTMNGRKWLTYGVSTAFVVTSICGTILALQALCRENNAKAGVATIQVNAIIIKIGLLLILVVQSYWCSRKYTRTGKARSYSIS